MGEYVATQLVKQMARKKINIDEAKVLVMGFTFKGDCPDVRNTKIIDIINELKEFNMDVDVYDNWASRHEVNAEYGIDLIEKPQQGIYDAIILAVDHSETKEMGANAIRALGKPEHVLYDVKYVLPLGESDIRL